MKKIALAVLIVIVVGVSAALAAGSAALGPFQLDLVSEDGTTLTYALTAMDDSELDHFGIEACVDGLVLPEEGPYASPIIEACQSVYSQCVAAESTLSYVTLDSGLAGVRFDDLDRALSEGETMIFQLTFEGYSIAPVEVGLHNGSDAFYGEIDGAACAPTAISLADFGVKESTADIILIVIVAAIVTITIYFIFRGLDEG